MNRLNRSVWRMLRVRSVFGMFGVAALAAILGAGALTGTVTRPASAQTAEASSADDLSFRATRLPQGRHMHGAAVVGDNLFVIGGAVDPEGYTNDVIVAPILSNGDIGNWRPTTPLPDVRVYIGNSTVVHGQTIYVAGGNLRSPGNPPKDAAERAKMINLSARNVLYATVALDGTIAEWKASADFPGPALQCGTAVAGATHLYVIGGADDANKPQNAVYRAAFNADGSLGPWSISTPLPYGLWFHGSALLGGRVFVWAGRDDKSAHRAETWAATVLADGSLGSWMEQPALPRPFSHCTSLGCQNFALSFGGVDSKKKAVKDVYFATESGGNLSQWASILASLPQARYGTAAYDARRGLVFLPGGKSGPEASAPLVADVVGFRVFTGGSTGGGAEVASATPEPPPARTTAAAPRSRTSTGGAPATVGWQFDFNQALAASRSAQKPLFVVLGSSKIAASTNVWMNVIQNPDVLDKIARGYVPVVCDIAKDQGPALTLGVYRVPAIAIVTPDGTVSKKLMGKFTVEDVLALP